MISVVGIGADGWDGLGEAARATVADADVIVGGSRHLGLIPDELGGERRAWPSPMTPLVDEIVAGIDGKVCVLASGDPMWHGVGATLARRLEPGALRVIPHPSAFQLGCARLGWPVDEVELIAAVARPAEVLAPALAPGRRVIAYVADGGGAATVARVLRERGYGPSRLVVMEELGGDSERIEESTADAWGDTGAAPLHVVAVEAVAEPGVPVLGRTPGLPDDAYEHDGQLTKRELRAITLAALTPVPGQLLWDIGAGSGSVGIEWMRAAPGARAIGIERDPERAARAQRNALDLGVPGLRIITGEAPDAAAKLARPDAIFVGGGITTPGLLDRCLDAIGDHGRLVANVVTLEGEALLAEAHSTHGGRLTRIGIERADPVGDFTGWRPAMAVTQWELRR